MGKIRAFIAIDVEDEKVKLKLREFQKRIIESGGDVKLVEPNNIHLTLRFLGDIEEKSIQKIVDSLRNVSLSPFDIQFRGVGAFPSLSHMNVIWVGVEVGKKELMRISESLEASLQRIGIPKDKKGFSPHITIARLKSGRNKQFLARLLGEHSDAEFGMMKVESIRLKRSVLTPQGPIYSTLFEMKA
ncbi:RNA 2',3'-cyclic phosphodiesterase [Candidatus Bathyarchaeota archaeon]|nr:RNA 2',3'-cyclic phosphodiesterase [Candidatus Bathyarchaeota archaeon]